MLHNNFKSTVSTPCCFDEVFSIRHLQIICAHHMNQAKTKRYLCLTQQKNNLYYANKFNEL